MLCTLLSWSNYAFCSWSRRTLFRFTFFHGFKCHTACDLARNLALNWNESVYCNVQCAHGSKFNHQFPLHFHFDMNQPISKKKMERLNFFFIDISRYSILGGTHPTLFPSICGRMKYYIVYPKGVRFGWQRCKFKRKIRFHVMFMWLCGDVKWNELIMGSLQCKPITRRLFFGMRSTFWFVNQILSNIFIQCIRWFLDETFISITIDSMSFENCQFFLAHQCDLKI